MGFNILKCSLVLFVSLICTNIYADEHFPFLGKINASGINVRAGSNTNFERIGQLAQGAFVVVVGQEYDWYKIQLPATAEAYVRADYVKPVTENISEVLADRVNVRARPNSESSSLGQLTQGCLVRVAGIENKWAKLVSPLGITGWVHKKFVDVSSLTVSEEWLNKPLTIQPLLTPGVNKGEVTVVGFVKVAVNPPDARVLYQMYVDDKAVFFLMDAPDLGQFSSRRVKVKGVIVRPAQDNQLPIVKVNEISLEG